MNKTVKIVTIFEQGITIFVSKMETNGKPHSNAVEDYLNQW